MENYKVTNTGLTIKVYADMNGTPFILIQGEFLKTLGFYENDKLSVLTQTDELILHPAEKYEEPRKRNTTEKQMIINDISNSAYDLITSEIPEDKAMPAWKYLDALTEELQKNMICDICEHNDNTTKGDD